MQLGRTWDGNDPRLLRQQPGQCDLSRCRLLSLCDFPEQIHQGLIRLAVLRIKARELITKIGAVERSALVDFSREEALAQWAIWNKTNSKFLKGWQQVLLTFAEPE